MKLAKLLKEQGLDLIDGAVRNQKLLQIWTKTPGDVPSLYRSYENNLDEEETQLYPCPYNFKVCTSPVLEVKSILTKNYSFDTGISVVGNLLSKIGCSPLDVSTLFKKKQNFSVSFDEAEYASVAKGSIERFYSQTSLEILPKNARKNWNKNNMYVITGVVTAKHLIIESDSSFDLEGDATATVIDKAEGKLDIAVNNSSSLKLSFPKGEGIPIAIQAYELDFDRDEFKKMNLVTDDKDWF